MYVCMKAFICMKRMATGVSLRRTRCTTMGNEAALDLIGAVASVLGLACSIFFVGIEVYRYCTSSHATTVSKADWAKRGSVLATAAVVLVVVAFVGWLVAWAAAA